MKNSTQFTKVTYLIPALLILCISNLSGQNDLNGYTYLGYTYDYDGSHHYFYLSNCETTWEEANAAAIEMGGYLATIRDPYENDYVGNWVVTYGIYNDDELRGAWIGFRGENGIYEWANGETITWEFWDYNYPAEPVNPDGAALIGGYIWQDYGSFYWTSSPVSAEAEYVVEFPYQPNCNNPNKSYVCHNGNTICVNNSAVQGHLDHGDLEGPCGPCNTYDLQSLPNEAIETQGHLYQTIDEGISESIEKHDTVHIELTSDQIEVFPNPAKEEIRVVLPEVHREGTLCIFSFTGQEVHTLHLTGQESIVVDLSMYASGLYLIDIRGSDGHYQKKFVKL